MVKHFQSRNKMTKVELMIKIEYKLKIKYNLLKDPKIWSNIHSVTTLIEVIGNMDESGLLRFYYVCVSVLSQSY